MSRRTDDRHYQLCPPRDGSGYYTVEQDDDGWRWYWCDGPGDDDIERSARAFPTRSDALRDAADDITANASSRADGKRLAARLRLAATRSQVRPEPAI